MYKRLLYLLFAIVLLSACTKKEPVTEESFKAMHQTIYEAWELDSEDEISALLNTILASPFLEEQLTSQLAMLKTRKDTNEKHKVEKITYHKLEIIESNNSEAVIYTDYTIEGYRFHGDYHEQKSSHRIYWHLINIDDGWKIDKTEQ